MRTRLLAVLTTALMAAGCSSVGLGGIGAQSVEGACAIADRHVGETESLFTADPVKKPKRFARDTAALKERMQQAYDEVDNITVKNQLDESISALTELEAFLADRDSAGGHAVVDRLEEQVVRLDRMCPSAPE